MIKYVYIITPILSDDCLSMWTTLEKAKNEVEILTALDIDYSGTSQGYNIWEFELDNQNGYIIKQRV